MSLQLGGLSQKWYEIKQYQNTPGTSLVTGLASGASDSASGTSFKQEMLATEMFQSSQTNSSKSASASDATSPTASAVGADTQDSLSAFSAFMQNLESGDAIGSGTSTMAALMNMGLGRSL